MAAARALGRKLLQGRISDGFALRDVYRNGWVGLSKRDEAAAAVDRVVDFDWLAMATESTKGRPRTRYWLNPKINDLRLEGPDKADNSAASSLLSVLTVADQGGSELREVANNTAETP